MVRMALNTENIQNNAQISDFSHSSNRAKDWANLLTSHKDSDKPCLWSTEDHTLVKKDIKWETKQVTNAVISKVFTTNCGNFGLIGYSDGNIIKFNMQSGNFIKTYRAKSLKPGGNQASSLVLGELHATSISGLFSDAYNRVIVSSDIESNIINWDFYSGDINKIVSMSPSSIVILRQSRNSQLFCAVFDDHRIELMDMYSMKKARTFKGHHNRVLDLSFTADNKQVLSCSLDSTIKIWDIISGRLVNNIKTEKPVISMDIDATGEFVVTAFVNSKELCIWNNMIGKEIMGDEEEISVKFVSDIKGRKLAGDSAVGLNSRKRYLGAVGSEANGKNNEFSVTEKEISELKNFFKEVNAIKSEESEQRLIELSSSEINKWIPLIHLETLKEKNKPKEPVESNLIAPFFLDFNDKISKLDQRVEGKVDGEQKLKEETNIKSKILRGQRNSLLEEIGSNLEKLVAGVQLGEDSSTSNEKSFKKMMREMKGLTPSQLDYEMRQMTFANLENVEKWLTFFEYEFQMTTEFDLKQIYFNGFLKACADMIIENGELAEVCQRVKKSIEKQWKVLDEEISKTLCMVEHFARIKN